MVIVRIILALAAMNDWGHYQMGVYNSFLQGDLNEEIYLQIPLGLATQSAPKHQVCQLIKSLYGLK